MQKALNRKVATIAILLVLAATLASWVCHAACNAQDGTLVTVTIGNIYRVPIFGNNPQQTNQKSTTVTLSPSPLPAGAVVTLTLSTTSGKGSATFDDGSTSKRITQTTTVNIRGVANSDTANNIALEASINNHFSSTCATMNFTVSTWPYNFQFQIKSANDHFGLTCTGFWSSESGDPNDLINTNLREDVIWTHPGSNPPFMKPVPSEYIGPLNSGTLGSTGQTDRHHYYPALVDFSTGATDYREGNQSIQFQDTVLNTSWDAGVLATYTITKTVAKDTNTGGTYTFTTSVTGSGGFSQSCTERP